ncbi:hypothetical protein N7G274_001038 [Stereocaulon virgatum]|uniref:SCA7 domain-containing protein n=1 Tax=Stereocaulon virgatum TaxID=373712 RepID=A0ABR4ANJ0_9LECA
MASTDMSRRASVASSSEISLQEPTSGKKPPPKQSKPTGGVDLKKKIAKKTKPKDAESNGIKTVATTRSPSPDSPAVNGNSAKPGDNTDTVKCHHCKKPVPEASAASHEIICLEKKKEKARKKKEAKEARAREAKAREAEERDKDGDTVMGDVTATQTTGTQPGEIAADDRPSSSTKNAPKKSASKNSNSDPKSKKRKADAEADKEPKKKKLKKDEPPKPKLPKPKGPVNVELQCGVALPNGGFCARSLTCKSHSMGSKRAVPGRSLPYDQLLAMYQKRNQAKIQKAALSAAAPLPDDEPLTGPVDSDEEKDAVMAAIARSRPQPLEQHIFVSTTSKYKHIRMKEMLANALGGRSGMGGGLFGGPRPQPEPVGGQEGIMQTTMEPTGGEGQSRKTSLGHQSQMRTGANTAGAGQVRKTSLAGSAGGVGAA